jgi:hypothetical protein
MRLLRSQRRYLWFRRLRNRLFRLRRWWLRCLWLLRTRVPGPHVRYVIDGIPPNSVSSLQATANGRNREKTAQQFAETSRYVSCPAPRETLARDKVTRHTRDQTAARSASAPPNEHFLKTRVMQLALPHRLAARRNSVTRCCVAFSFSARFKKKSASKKIARTSSFNTNSTTQYESTVVLCHPHRKIPHRRKK